MLLEKITDSVPWFFRITLAKIWTSSWLFQHPCPISGLFRSWKMKSQISGPVETQSLKSGDPWPFEMTISTPSVLGELQNLFRRVKDCSCVKLTKKEPSKKLEWDHALSRQMEQINRVDYLVLRHLNITALQQHVIHYSTYTKTSHQTFFQFVRLNGIPRLAQARPRTRS